ncbi:hypothetical protein GW17_00014072 [Ensete ventricosum]|nr:hypothetical protein GW17_00014072 [Ensete ventricosum]
MEKMELNVQNGDQEGELGTQVNNYYNYLEQDHAVALWVKNFFSSFTEFNPLSLLPLDFTDMDWFGRVEVAFQNRSCVLYHSLGSLNSSTRPLNG